MNTDEIKDENIKNITHEDQYISIENFAKVQIKIGEIKEVSFVENSEKLLSFIVDVGEDKPRHIFSGIRLFITDKDSLLGKKVPVVCNLPPRKIMGIPSEGMIIYAVGDKTLDIIETNKEVANGTEVR